MAKASSEEDASEEDVKAALMKTEIALPLLKDKSIAVRKAVQPTSQPSNPPTKPSATSSARRFMPMVSWGSERTGVSSIMIEGIQSICFNTAYACAAGVGTAVIVYGAVRGMKFLSGGVKCLAAASLAGSLIIGGMTVTGVYIAGAKTNDTNQMENVERRMENAGGASTILHSPFSILHSASSITDEDISNQWRVASVSSNALAAATFAMPTNATVWESAQACGRGWGAWQMYN